MTLKKPKKTVYENITKLKSIGIPEKEALEIALDSSRKIIRKRMRVKKRKKIS